MSKPTDEELKSFKENGFFGFNRQLFSPADLEKIKKLTEKTFAGESPNTICITNLALRNPLFLKWAQRKEILELVEPIVGSNIGLMGVTLFWKKPNSEEDVDWHRDSEYLHTYHLFDRVNFVSVILALTPSKKISGCLEFVRESHKNPIHRNFKIDGTQRRMFVSAEEEKKHIETEVQNGKISKIELEAGEYSIHDAEVLHGSGSNRSNEDRILLNFKFFPTTLKSYAAEVEKKHGIRQPLYLIQGVDISGCCDISLVEKAGADESSPKKQ